VSIELIYNMNSYKSDYFFIKMSFTVRNREKLCNKNKKHVEKCILMQFRDRFYLNNGYFWPQKKESPQLGFFFWTSTLASRSLCSLKKFLELLHFDGLKRFNSGNKADEANSPYPFLSPLSKLLNYLLGESSYKSKSFNQ